MSGSRRNKAPARSGARRRQNAHRDFWGRDGEDDVPEPIRPSDDPAAMVRSLGPPPLPSRELVAEHYFTAVYDKAAAVATALAAASGLLPPDEDGDAG
jgi:hypothetical protein